MEPQVNVPLRKIQDMEYQIASLGMKVDMVMEVLQKHPKGPSVNRLLNKKEACECLGIKPTKLDALRRCGKIASIKMGNHVRFKMEDLEDYIRRMREV